MKEIVNNVKELGEILKFRDYFKVLSEEKIEITCETECIFTENEIVLCFDISNLQLYILSNNNRENIVYDKNFAVVNDRLEYIKYYLSEYNKYFKAIFEETDLNKLKDFWKSAIEKSIFTLNNKNKLQDLCELRINDLKTKNQENIFLIIKEDISKETQLRENKLKQLSDQYYDQIKRELFVNNNIADLCDRRSIDKRIKQLKNVNLSGDRDVNTLQKQRTKKLDNRLSQQEIARYDNYRLINTIDEDYLNDLKSKQELQELCEFQLQELAKEFQEMQNYNFIKKILLGYLKILPYRQFNDTLDNRKQIDNLINFFKKLSDNEKQKYQDIRIAINNLYKDKFKECYFINSNDEDYKKIFTNITDAKISDDKIKDEILRVANEYNNAKTITESELNKILKENKKVIVSSIINSNYISSIAIIFEQYKK
ncbi:8481_t:CDS:2, partial [Cetraspora pellucida]